MSISVLFECLSYPSRLGYQADWDWDCAARNLEPSYRAPAASLPYLQRICQAFNETTQHT
jgi:hypothetical protein